MWPFNKQSPELQTWPIVRTKPTQKTYGRAISVFINNMQCHLTTVDAYSDGAVDAWGFLDLSLFKAKLQKRWVVSAPKDDKQIISVFNFGMTGFRRGEWWQTPTTILNEVESIVKSLNPTMTGLIDMEGSDTIADGKIRRAKMGLSNKKPYRRDEARNEEVLASPFPILRADSSSFELTQLFLFSDGQIQIGPSGELFPLEQIQLKYERGEIANSAPEGSRVIISGLGSFETTHKFGGVTVKDRILELKDKLGELNGQTSVGALCVQAFREYEKNPSPENKEVLRDLYERVPDHLKHYCGDMDTKDGGIRRILYGE